MKPDEIQQIEEWLYLKAECDECINLHEIDGEPALPERSLGPIEEMDEGEEEITANSSDSDSEICQKINDIDDTVSKLLTKFEIETDSLVEQCYRDYISAHPPTCDSVGSLNKMEIGYTRERRRSIQPGAEISSLDLAKLESLNQSTEASQLKKAENSLLKCQTNIAVLENQITELEKTIKVKEKTVAELDKAKKTRSKAKSTLLKKKIKLQEEYEKQSQKLARAITSKKNRGDVEHLKEETTKTQKKIDELTKVHSIASESNREVEKTRESMKEFKKQLDKLQESLKEERKVKDSLEKELEIERKSSKFLNMSDGKNKIRDMSTRIQNLNFLLHEKEEERKQVVSKDAEKALRHEIRNLRATKNHLNDQIAILRLRKGKSIGK